MANKLLERVDYAFGYSLTHAVSNSRFTLPIVKISDYYLMFYSNRFLRRASILLNSRYAFLKFDAFVVFIAEMDTPLFSWDFDIRDYERPTAIADVLWHQTGLRPRKI